MNQASKMKSPDNVPETRQYLTFTLAGETFAVGTLSVKEIIEYGQLTGVPMMPPSIRGVINLRGAVVPVIDLGARFGGRQTEVGRRTCIVILEVDHADEQQVIGVLVDAVNEVLEIAPADIEPPPAFGAHIRTDFIQGMGKVGGHFVILLDIGRVLSVDELAVLAQVAGSPTTNE
ncbi:chemotaxis protein CheW [Pseudomonas sp. B21-056]|jgi:purine-binding chemotaxis protein CheW|uniref:chemotaxis protein CheW n=1 Tax=Pseudomonas sp. B21-056 TaxID=2895495 RepID=UPI0022315623|nr:chemotaxis protein CheW [Pseudomonas sp. B21-056]UZE21518.1 chemotaxis protein CheW [Pseudomonas sp. B21-056]